MSVNAKVNKNNRISRVWKYFSKSGEKFAKCSTCKNEYKYCGNTTNLIDHMKRKHQFIWFGESPIETANDEQNEDSVAASPAPKTRKTIKDYIDRSSFYSDGSKNKEHLDKIYLRMLASDMEPLRMGDHRGFRDFVKALDSKYQIPDKSTVKNVLLPKNYDALKEKLQSALNVSKHVAITTDLWTSNSNDGIMAVTCHFFSNGQLIAPLLEAVNVEGSHNAENISEVLNSVLLMWGIRSKCVAITTDNARSMINAVEKLEINHIPCFAHTLNLVVTDTFNLTSFEGILRKCKAIVTYFRMSTLASDKLRRIQRDLNKSELKLIQSVSTRWNSTFHMLQRILTLKSELALALNECEKAPSGLNAEEYLIISEITQVLEPFETATTKISGETYITLSFVIPLIRGIRIKMASMQPNIQTDEAKQILVQLYESVQSRLKPYENVRLALLATILDPRIKRKGFRTLEESKKASQLLEKTYTSHLRTNRIELPELESEDSSITFGRNSAEKSDDLLSFLDEPERNLGTPGSDAIVDIRQYLEKPAINKNECPIQFWEKSGSRLKEMADKFLCIPATSVPSERIFSKAGQILTERRNRLKPKGLNELLFLKQNYAIFEKN